MCLAQRLSPFLSSLIIKPSDINDDYLMYLKSIILDPVEEIKDEGWGVE